MYTWCDIDLRNLENNINYIRSKVLDNTMIMPVVKQNAYGHGIVDVALCAERSGVDFFGVHSKDEALLLLENHISMPILILSNVIEDNDSHFLIKNKVRFSVRDEYLLSMLDAEAAKLGIKAIVHIKVDTGMNRLGINDEVAENFVINAIEKYKNISIEGLFSHFSSADIDEEYTLLQLGKFNEICHSLESKGIEIPIKHIANSSAVLTTPAAVLDMVRVGITMYGISPIASEIPELKPVLSLKTKVIHIKGIPPESFVSYSKTFKTKRSTTLAVIDAGYGHGYPWSLSNNSEVLIKGKRRKIIGRVCMDHMLVDITDDLDNIEIGDTVTLIGKDCGQEITVKELSQKANTIPYEILTRLQHLPKKYSK